jgi:hypothetical protein
MGKLEFLWKDVSEEPEIEARADKAPELRRDLIQLGFRSAGYVERWNPWVTDKKTADIVKKAYNKSTSRMITYTSRVQEIFASPDGRAQALLCMTPLGPSVNLRSVSEGGWVVNTGSKTVRGSGYRMNPMGLLLAMIGEAQFSAKTKADSGYFKQEKAASAAELWKQHKLRVQSILDSSGQKLRPQDGTAIYTAGAYQLHRIFVSEKEATDRFSRIFNAVSRVLIVLISIFECIALIVLYNLGRVSFPAAMIIIILTFLSILGAIILTMVIFHRHVLPRLAGPPPMILDDLLRDLQKRIGPPAVLPS